MALAMNQIEQEQIIAMFDRIANTYDAVNRILSFGLDASWRDKAALALPPGESLAILDIATGTGDLLLTMCEKCPRISTAIGVDMAEKMLLLGQEKVNKTPFSKLISLQQADGSSLPFEAESFDAVSIAFGIRNIVLRKKALSEMERVIKPGGCALILEFSLPQNKIIRFFYLLYFRHILPRIGALISGHHNAYSYLNNSVENFIKPELFIAELKAVGFKDVNTESLSFGIATLYKARKA
jgi:demethylmenaquinone methyltransferase/2-methoxy-6-polyprenyl-1,4-benzoquinol methylase